METHVPPSHVPASTTEYEKGYFNKRHSWENLRKKLLDAAIEEVCLPSDSTCLICHEKAVVPCKYCGPRIYFCESCGRKAHEKQNVFHVMEEWKVSVHLKSRLYMSLDYHAFLKKILYILIRCTYMNCT